VIEMMTTIKITKIIIDHIKDIEVADARKFDELLYSSRSLDIWTEEGEKFEIVLEANALEQLQFKKNDWLTPKLYKGKSMHEQEMDENK
jgi:hypothetical protein